MRCFIGECIKRKYCILPRVSIRQGSGLSYQDFYLASLKVLFDFRLIFDVLLFWQPQGNTLQPAKFSRRFHKTLFTWFTKSGNLGWAPRRFLFSSFFSEFWLFIYITISIPLIIQQPCWLIALLGVWGVVKLKYSFVSLSMFAEVNFASTASLNQFQFRECSSCITYLKYIQDGRFELNFELFWIMRHVIGVHDRPHRCGG